MPKLIKVSEAAYAELKRRSAEEGRTMVVVVDRLLLAEERADGMAERLVPTRWKTEVPAEGPKRRKAEAPAVASGGPELTEGACPKCGHRPGIHRGGTSGTRCELCTSCLWAEVPA